MITKLKLKIKFSHLEVLPEVLLHYKDFIAIMVKSTRKNHPKTTLEGYYLKLSIAADLYFFFKKKEFLRFPKESYKVEFQIHEAIIFQAALLHFISETSDDFKRNAMEIIKNEINQKLENDLTFITQ